MKVPIEVYLSINFYSYYCRHISKFLITSEVIFNLEGDKTIPEISRILMGYKKSLDKSRERYERMIQERGNNTKIFYESFLKDLIINLNEELGDDYKKIEFLRLLKNFSEKIKSSL